MRSDDKLFNYVKVTAQQILKSPTEAPRLFSKGKHVYSIVKNGEKQRELRQKQLNIPIPFACIFSVTWRCNLKCTGCYALNYNVKDELGLDKIVDTVKECNDLGTYFFVIAGGEPLLIDGIIERLSAINGAFFALYTNATILNGQHIQALKKANNILPIISIEGSAHMTDCRRGDKVSKKVIEAMEMLKKNNVLFGFSTMVTHKNLNLVTSRDYIDNLWGLGARFGFFIDYIPCEKNLIEEYVLTDEDRTLKDKILEHRNKEARPPIFNLPPDEYKDGECMAAGKGILHINADGYVEPCPFSHFAADNIKDKSMKDILDSNFMQEIRNNLHKMDNPNKECQLFVHKKEVEAIAKRTGAKWTET